MEQTSTRGLGELLAQLLAVNTQAFVPELLGIELACEVMEGRWSGGAVARSSGMSALDAYFARVRQSLPYEGERMWQRACSAFWILLLGECGNADERAALAELATAFSAPSGAAASLE